MAILEADIAVIGSGFAGSLTALIAERIGLRAVLIERGSHPRFAIGESSTPIADLVLAELAERYDLPRLTPLTQYGSWRRAYPEVVCGRKRGFSYFRHERGRVFVPRDDHANELLVAGNPDDDRADTHWFRADFDAFLVNEAQAAGVHYLDRTLLHTLRPGETWRLRGTREESPVDIRASFLVDATGGGGVLAAALGIEANAAAMHTNSRTIYTHFAGVRPWQELYEGAGGSVADHPFDCDAAALHQIFDGGWMWVLRFDNGVTSAGLVLDRTRYPLDESITPEDEWRAIVARYPSIAEQFGTAEAIRPFCRTGRLQRSAAKTAGDNWAMLPAAACFIDPLHSTGNAHSLVGIERLMRILEETRPGADRTDRLAAYDRTTRREAELLDLIVHGGFVSFEHFDLMVAFSMLYFIGATFSEHRRREGRPTRDDGFLLSHDGRFVELVGRYYADACRLARSPTLGVAEIQAFRDALFADVASYNVAGLCDETKRNMYGYE